ncbi:MAG: serine/threonine-protein kinase [Polyangiaceae bacterium]
MEPRGTETDARGAIIAGKYKLLELIGSGSMGVVWRAEHLGLGAPVALKLIHKSPMGNAQAGELNRRFAREARAAAAVRGPHVAQILDHGVDETGRPYIALELLKGDTLDIHLARVGRLSLADTKRFVTHVARALSRAQEVGYIHRDLKPSNVFIVLDEGEPLAKVLDFGLAKAFAGEVSEESALTEVGQILGTPTFMSPEQIQGKKLDHRSDLWSLAIITYLCVCGELPFEGDNVLEVMMAILNEPPRRPSMFDPSLAPAFDAWFNKAVCKDPNERFQSARELADALAAVECAEVPDLPLIGSYGKPRVFPSEMELDVTMVSSDADLPRPPEKVPSISVVAGPPRPIAIPKLYDSSIDLDELTEFWQTRAHSPNSAEARKPTVAMGDRLTIRDRGEEIGPLLTLEMIQGLRSGHLGRDVMVRPHGSAVWHALDGLAVRTHDGRVLDLAELSAPTSEGAPPIRLAAAPIVPAPSSPPLPPAAAPTARPITAESKHGASPWLLISLALIIVCSTTAAIVLLVRR